MQAGPRADKLETRTLGCSGKCRPSEPLRSELSTVIASWCVPSRPFIAKHFM
jgi:hypothetical protein